MVILHVLVARSTIVLPKFSVVSNNTGVVTHWILEKLPAKADSKLCFSQDRYPFHILRIDGLTFLCMAINTFGKRIPFLYLEDIQMRFMKNHGKMARYAPAYALNDESSRVLHQQMEFFPSNLSANTLNHVRGEVGEIRTIMVENIEKIWKRGIWWEKYWWDVFGEQVSVWLGKPWRDHFDHFQWSTLITHSRGRKLQRDISPIRLIRGKIWPWDPFHFCVAIHGHF